MASDKSHFGDRKNSIVVDALPISRIPEASSSGGQLGSEIHDKMEPDTARLKFTDGNGFLRNATEGTLIEE